MTDTTRFDELPEAQQGALRALRDPGAEAPGPDGIAAVRDAFVALAGDPGDDVPDGRQARIGSYLLGRQSPGQAAGTWSLLGEDDAALAWANRLRDGLAGLVGDDAPSLPSDERPVSPTDRARTGPGDDGATLGERRGSRSRRRTKENVQAATAELLSPFRGEAIEAQRTADDRVELPDFAPRPVRLALYGLTVALLVGLVFTIVVRIPINVNATVLVTRLPDSAPGSEEGIEIVALIADAGGQADDAPTGADVRRGDTLRVALPGEDNRSPVEIRAVSDGRQSPRTVIDRYRLPVGQANVVRTPGYVAVARLKTPEGRSKRSYEGTTTTEASIQTGSQRIISLLF